MAYSNGGRVHWGIVKLCNTCFILNPYSPQHKENVLNLNMTLLSGSQPFEVIFLGGPIQHTFSSQRPLEGEKYVVINIWKIDINSDIESLILSSSSTI